MSPLRCGRNLMNNISFVIKNNISIGLFFVYLRHKNCVRMKRIPKRLDKCPIIESVLEIRFDSDFDRNIVFPVLYSLIRGDFMEPSSLPILQIPDSIREVDPNLRFQPYYRIVLKNDPNISLQIGPKVLAFCFTQHYEGWDVFKDYVLRYIRIFQEANIIKKVLRMGFRVINFFDWDIYQKGMNLMISLSGEEIPYNETALKTKFIKDNYESIVNIINSATLNNTQGKRVGSIIDIDTSIANCDDFFSKVSLYMDEAHSIEKSLFFNILTEEQINALNPEYDV